MLIQVIKDNAEQHIIDGLERHSGKSLNLNLFQCRFSLLTFSAPKQDDIILKLKDLLIDKNGILLYCEDGDIFIQWEGTASAIIKVVEQEIKDYCSTQSCETLPDDFFHYYDSHVHGEELRIECRKKLKAQASSNGVPEQKIKEPEIKKIKAEFTQEQLASIIKQLSLRGQRISPEILIVEDQEFSCKLLLNVLDPFYTCRVAKNGEDAISEYATYAPDVVFLDIELPDLNGHALAKLFRDTDPEAYIVMVTGNNYAKDVEMAKANKAQGFVIKPYNKQKILGSVESYIKLVGKGD